MKTFTFSLREEGDGLHILCEDDGNGVPAGDNEHIFKKGFGRNTGLGLFLVREILGITGIPIRETGVYHNGARFEIIVPHDAYRKGSPVASCCGT